MKRNVLVFSFDIPYPDNYGGAKDVWERILLLQMHDCIIDIISVFIDPKRLKQFETSLEREKVNLHCSFKVNYLNVLSINMPVSAAIRRIGKNLQDQCLPEILKKSYDFVLIEHHKSFEMFLGFRKYICFKKVFFRVHNIESEYYSNLSASEKNFFKKIFYHRESNKYKKYQTEIISLNLIDKYLFISNTDMDNTIYKNLPNKELISPIINSDRGEIDNIGFNSRENRVLYLGNLDLPDNILSIKCILEILYPLLKSNEIKLTIAGKCSKEKEQRKFRYLVSNTKNIEFIFNVSSRKREEIYHKSKIFFLYSMNSSGVKLKLAESINYNLPVISNANGIYGSGLENCVFNIDKCLNEDTIRDKIKLLINNEEAWKKYRSDIMFVQRRLTESATKSYLNLFDIA